MWPIITFNQIEQALVSEATTKVKADGRIDFTNHPEFQSGLAKFAGKIGRGDSGNPAFLIYGGWPILLYCVQFGGCGQGPCLHLRREDIQRTMDDLCPGYKLDEFDFSAVGGGSGRRIDTEKDTRLL